MIPYALPASILSGGLLSLLFLAFTVLSLRAMLFAFCLGVMVGLCLGLSFYFRRNRHKAALILAICWLGSATTIASFMDSSKLPVPNTLNSTANPSSATTQATALIHQRLERSASRQQWMGCAGPGSRGLCNCDESGLLAFCPGTAVIPPVTVNDLFGLVFDDDWSADNPPFVCSEIREALVKLYVFPCGRLDEFRDYCPFLECFIPLPADSPTTTTTTTAPLAPTVHRALHPTSSSTQEALPSDSSVVWMLVELLAVFATVIAALASCGALLRRICRPTGAQWTPHTVWINCKELVNSCTVMVTTCCIFVRCKAQGLNYPPDPALDRFEAHQRSLRRAQKQGGGRSRALSKLFGINKCSSDLPAPAGLPPLPPQPISSSETSYSSALSTISEDPEVPKSSVNVESRMAEDLGTFSGLPGFSFGPYDFPNLVQKYGNDAGACSSSHFTTTATVHSKSKASAKKPKKKTSATRAFSEPPVMNTAMPKVRTSVSFSEFEDCGGHTIVDEEFHDVDIFDDEEDEI